MMDQTALLTCDNETHDKIVAIVRRVRENVNVPDGLALLMDLTACHNKGHVDLDALLAARANDLIHDIAGIASHFDRETGELTDCFVPRCRKAS